MGIHPILNTYHLNLYDPLLIKGDEEESIMFSPKELVSKVGIEIEAYTFP
jgi:hypothetical protein